MGSGKKKKEKKKSALRIRWTSPHIVYKVQYFASQLIEKVSGNMITYSIIADFNNYE